MDILSSLQHLQHPDISAFFRLIGLFDYAQSSDTLVFSSSETDAGTMMNEFLKKVDRIDNISQNAFLELMVNYLEDVGKWHYDYSII